MDFIIAIAVLCQTSSSFSNRALKRKNECLNYYINCVEVKKDRHPMKRDPQNALYECLKEKLDES